VMAWGFGYFTQPYIIVRFMAIPSAEDLPTARRIGITWMAVIFIGAMATGFFGLAYRAKAGQAIDERKYW
jgi:SSS family solute:Na+ symporter